MRILHSSQSGLERRLVHGLVACDISVTSHPFQAKKSLDTRRLSVFKTKFNVTFSALHSKDHLN